LNDPDRPRWRRVALATAEHFDRGRCAEQVRANGTDKQSTMEWTVDAGLAKPSGSSSQANRKAPAIVSGAEMGCGENARLGHEWYNNIPVSHVD
jgi:hypothetical protein